MKRGLVISGGGALGAYGAGTLEALNNDYDAIVGISTGALMGGHVGLKQWKKLKEAYTSVRNKDVFDLKWYRPNPFKKNGKENIWAIIYALITSQPTISTTSNLRKLIYRFFTEEDFEKAKNSGFDYLVGTQNLRQEPSELHYFNIHDYNYDEFVHWIWASATPPLFGSLVKRPWKDGDITYDGIWTDGGVSEIAGLDPLCNMGCTEIDVIMHRVVPQHVYDTGEDIKNLMQNAGCTYTAMRHDIEFEHFFDKIIDFNKQGIVVNVYWIGRKLTNNSLLFDKKTMQEWWDEGRATAFDPTRITFFKP